PIKFLGRKLYRSQITVLVSVDNTFQGDYILNGTFSKGLFTANDYGTFIILHGGRQYFGSGSRQFIDQDHQGPVPLDTLILVVIDFDLFSRRPDLYDRAVLDEQTCHFNYGLQ